MYLMNLCILALWKFFLVAHKVTVSIERIIDQLFKVVKDVHEKIWSDVLFIYLYVYIFQCIRMTSAKSPPPPPTKKNIFVLFLSLFNFLFLLFSYLFLILNFADIRRFWMSKFLYKVRFWLLESIYKQL